MSHRDSLDALEAGDPLDAQDVQRRSGDREEQERLLGGSSREDFEIEEQSSTVSQRRNRLFSILSGPDPAQPRRIRPYFAAAQCYLPDLLARHFSKRARYGLLAAALTFWLLFLGGLLLSSQLPAQSGDGHPVVNLDCVDTLWQPKNGCGIDGIDCRPFHGVSFAFACPANCAGVTVLNPRAIGPIEVNYRPLVVGDLIYRGDSFLCGSAIHAGVVNDGHGGCGRINIIGQQAGFAGHSRNGINSIPFDSYFPLSFTVSEDSSFNCSADRRQPLIWMTMFITIVITVCSASSSIFFPVFIMVFALVSFASDPPAATHLNTTVLPDHLSMFARRLLPGLAWAVVIYQTTVKRTLSNLTAHIEKTVLWLGGFYFGALSNYTFDWLPIQRLTAHDLKQQPGAMVALFGIIAVLAILFLVQAYSLYLEGRLPRYLALYGLFIAAILLSLLIPGVNLRIHHYILALLLLPGTSIQTRISLLCQGLLLGLFVNGVARWDFDSVLQTTDALRGDGRLDSILPHIPKPAMNTTSEGLTALFNLTKATSDTELDGVSVLINDVERYRAFFDDVEASTTSINYTWRRSAGLLLNEYFRFAYVARGRTLDYTQAATLFANGSWLEPVR